MTRTLAWIAAVALLAACTSSLPASPNSSAATHTWQPAKPNDPLVLTDRATDPNVPSTLPPGTRVPLAAEPLAANGIALPNGTFLQSLNGVVDPVKLGVPDGAVLAPVIAVSVEHDRREWYVHLDGSYSTSVYAWRQDLNRWDAVSMFSQPAKDAK